MEILSFDHSGCTNISVFMNNAASEMIKMLIVFTSNENRSDVGLFLVDQMFSDFHTNGTPVHCITKIKNVFFLPLHVETLLIFVYCCYGNCQINIM